MDSHKMQQIINAFNGDFVENENGYLKDVFCNIVFDEKVNFDYLTEHVKCGKHIQNRCYFPLKQQIKRTFLRHKFQSVAQELVESVAEECTYLLVSNYDQLKFSENAQKEIDEIVSKRIKLMKKPTFGNLEMVKLAIEEKVFVDGTFGKVKCNVCHIEIDDSISKMVNHLASCDHKLPEFGELHPSHNSTAINLINKNKYLIFFESEIKCIACKIQFQSVTSTIKSHVESDNHKKSVTAFEQKGKMDNLIDNSDFCSWLGLTFCSLNISLHKIDGLSDFLQRFTGRKIPSETTLRRHMGHSTNLVYEMVRKEIGDNYIYISMDEATNTLQKKKYVSVIVGTLIPDNPKQQKSFVIDYVELDKTWVTNDVVNVFIQTVKKLYGEKDWIEKGQQLIKLFVTDAGSQMIAAAKYITTYLFPNMHFFTCLCHGVHNLSDTIIKCYPTAKQFIMAMNNILSSSPKRMAIFKELFELATPIFHVETRWGTGLKSIEYWYINYESAVNYLNTLDNNEKSHYISIAKELVKLEITKTELQEVTERYGFIPNIITKLEKRNQFMIRSIELVTQIGTELEKYNLPNTNDELIHQTNQQPIPQSIGRIIFNRYTTILEKNKGYQTLCERITDGDFRQLLYAPIGSYESERGNKIFKSSLNNDKSNFKFENVREWSMTRFNSIALGLRRIKPKNSDEQERLQINNSRGNSFAGLFIESEKIETEVEFDIHDIDDEFDLSFLQNNPEED